MDAQEELDDAEAERLRTNTVTASMVRMDGVDASDIGVESPGGEHSASSELLADSESERGGQAARGKIHVSSPILFNNQH
jgi:hypothetical protein